ncbi:MAG: ABC transporter ATP-binding protein [Clostridiales bacterium]|jgi:zinc transport system ATP-binding protein|nr:ABC transporter ATP-binding protein [Clostridiales bacterium]
MVIVEVNNLQFGYENVQLLSNLSFSVSEGDFIGIVGSNGAGKSTLLKLIVGLMQPQSGCIKLFGTEIGKFKNYCRLSYVSQQAANINSSLPATSMEIVLSGMCGKKGIFKWTSGEDREYAEYCLETVGMKDYGKRLVGKLSGGQLQRVLIAKALVNKPELMLLDEPTVGIDNKSVEYICCLLARLNEEYNISILMVTHDIPSVLSHANKLLVFSEDGNTRMTANHGDLQLLENLLTGHNHHLSHIMEEKI